MDMTYTDALIVVDMQRGYIDPRFRDEFPNAYAVEDRVLRNVRALVDFAHSKSIRVFFAVIAFSDGQMKSNLWVKHIPNLRALRVGSALVEVDPRLGFDPDRDVVFAKQYPSIFTTHDFGVALADAGITRCFLCGITMSGCVIASALDALTHGVVPIVVRDAVADRSGSLRDIALDKMSKTYGRVLSSEETFAALSTNG